VKRREKIVGPSIDPPTTPIVPVEPDRLWWIMQQTQLEIARRAYELFKARGGEHGHDWDDWFRAESELLCPVSVALAEGPQQISVRVNVLGFNHNELKIGVEPQRIVVFGEKKVGAIEAEGGMVEHINWCPDQILQTIHLSGPIDPGRAVITLRSGVLTFELPRMTSRTQSQAA
jgi:HSP20 family molecular chaperone IbpA